MAIAFLVVAGAGTVVAIEAAKPSQHVAPPPACTTGGVLATWPLGRLVNQTIVIPADETDVPALAPAARDGYGGAILFGTSAPAGLGSQLRQLRGEVPGHLGLLVMTDEEGGGIQRMANLVGSMPWPSEMGATMTPAEIQALARRVGTKMARYGVDVDLAPVVDVDGRAVEPGASDPDGFRSFSGDVKVVSADGVAFLKGLLQAGVIPVVKHFPGLGGATGNTDDGPGDTRPWSDLVTGAIPAFEAAIKAGVPAVMMSNAIVPGLTGTAPASLSFAAVTRELRQRLGFRGLIVTDSLSAGAILDSPLSLSVPAAAVLALEAGDDMVLFGPTGSMAGDLAVAAGISKAVREAVTAGRLRRSVVTAAVSEVLAAKNVSLCRA